jgi:general secretion pathway protein C
MRLVHGLAIAACVATSGAFVGRGVSDVVALALPPRALAPPAELTVVSPIEIARSMSDRLAGGEEPPPGPAPVPPPLACAHDLRVHAIVVGFEGDGRSYASVTHAGGTAMLRPGMRLGELEVGAIARERVTLVRGDDRCELALFAPEDTGPVVSDPQPAIAGPAHPALEGGVERISDTHFRIERRIVESLFQNQAEAMGLARLVPQRDGDRVVAVRLYGIRRTSLLGRMGLQNGDAVRTINGYDASSPDQMLRAMVELRGASRISIAIVRRGEPLTLEYDIAD